MSAAARLKGLIASKGIVMAPGAPDSITARLVEKAGFPAVYMTGLGATASRLGTPDIGLLTQAEMTDEARGTDDLIIIGRTDAMPAAGPEEAIRRAKLYQQSGVDLVFVDGIKKIAEVEAVAKHVPGPKVVSIVDGNETTALTARDLEGMGFQVVLYAVTALFTATRAVADALANLRETGTPRSGPRQHSYAEFCELIDLPFHQSLDERFGR